MQGNDFVKILLRSPLQNLLGGNIMLITVTGRKTGRVITTPVNFYRQDNILWVISSRDRNWWRNVCGGADVILHLGGHDVKAVADTVLDEAKVADQIGDYVRHLPMAAGALGVKLQNGLANCDDTARLAKERLFVKIKVEA